MGKIEPETRDYNMSDPDLKGKADQICISVLRDKEEFAQRGVTETKITAVQAKATAFGNIPTDDALQSIVTKATENKDNLRMLVLKSLRTIRTMGQNQLDLKSANYRAFGFDGMDLLTDLELVFRGKHILTEAKTQQAVLAEEGLTDEILIFDTKLIADFEKSKADITEAENNRDLIKQFRIKSGNSLYKDLTRYSNTGKDIWVGVDEAKYNDYVIYGASTTHHAPGEGSIEGLLTAAATGVAVPNATILVQGTQITTTTDSNGHFKGLHLKEGTYVLICVKEGLNDLHIENVVVIAGNIVTVSGQMIKK